MFLYKRFVKFYLGYWPIYILSLSMGVFLFGRSLDESYGLGANIPINLIKDFLGINGINSYNITWWFNKLIITLYILFPVFYVLLRNNYTVVFLVLFTYYQSNMFPFVTGMILANYWNKVNNILNCLPAKYIFLLLLILLLAMCYIRQFTGMLYYYKFFIDGIIAAALSLCIIVIKRLTSLNFRVLKYLGKHSMNIYMLHTFIFAYFFKDFIYGFIYPPLIFMALLSSSLALSILIEYAKHKCGIYILQNKLINITYKKKL